MHGSEIVIMKKNTLAVWGTCFILIIAGVSYSITYRGRENSSRVVSTLQDLPGQGDPEKNSLQKQPQTNGDQADTDTVSLSQAADSSAIPNQKDPEIYVHLCGAVRKPAVYRVENGARLVEVIGLAEGLTETAAADYINQAMLVEDGQRIYIPTKDEVEGLAPVEYIVGEDASGEQVSGPKLIDINRADAGELMELPGIGEAKAESIIAYRNANGEFTATTELMKVPGIKEGLYEQIVTYITVN